MGFRDLAETIDTIKTGPFALLEILRRMCLVRGFRKGFYTMVKEGVAHEMDCLTRPTEAVPSVVTTALYDYRVFPHCRHHPVNIVTESDLWGFKESVLSPAATGCSHSGNGENAHQAVAWAMEHGGAAVCLLDAASVDDQVVTALGFASAQRLPVIFLCEHHSGEMSGADTSEMAEVLGMERAEVSDDPVEVLYAVERVSTRLPALVKVASTDVGVLDWYQILKKRLRNSGLDEAVGDIEMECRTLMGMVWGRGSGSRARRWTGGW